MTESAIWTEALKLASQHRYDPTYIADAKVILCVCGFRIDYAGKNTADIQEAFKAHIRTLPHPQPKPEPRYEAVLSGMRWYVIELSTRLDKAEFHKSLPNAEARARALCEELNGEPRKPRFTLRVNSAGFTEVSEDGVSIITFEKQSVAREFCAWKNAQETQPHGKDLV